MKTLAFVLMSYLSASTVGKIAGTVVDKATGEALAGANVMLTGTSLGGSADENGKYFIINVYLTFKTTKSKGRNVNV